MKKCRFGTLVLGLGSILHRDEGIGIRVIEYLHKCPLPKDVEFLDAAATGANILDALSHRDHVIIIDTADIDAPAGTIRKLTPRDWLGNGNHTPNLHNLDIPKTLAMAHILGCAPRNVICLAIAPESCEPGMELTATLAPLVSKIADNVLNEIQAL